MKNMSEKLQIFGFSVYHVIFILNLILNPIFILKLFCIKILSINPKVLPNKRIIIDEISKLYIFIQPFLILLG